MIEIDKTTHQANRSGFYKSKKTKDRIVLCASLRKNSNHIIRLKNNSKIDFIRKWPQYTISRTGMIYEHYNPLYYSDILGNRDIDTSTIFVMLENMGSLKLDNNDSYKNWIVRTMKVEHVITIERGTTKSIMRLKNLKRLTQRKID
jgi:hypothetical protein